jgi:hypothetical protein
MAAYLDILKPQVLTDVFKQVVASADPILNFMGFQPGGTNEKSYGHGREGDIHIFNDPRTSAKLRAPGTPAARSKKQNLEAFHIVYPRMHDSVSLLAEFFHNLGMITNPAQRDIAGRDMIRMQTKTLEQKAANWRIAMCVGMLRDSLYFQQSGDDWYVSYTSSSAVAQANTNIPTGNKTQLNMTLRDGSTSVHGASIIDISWANPNANIPLHFAKINQARAAQGVGPVRNVLCNSIMWQYVINNNYIAGQAGIVSPPFQTYQRQVGTRPDGSALHEYTGTINSLPGVTFHISDEGLELYDGSTEVFTKHFPDTMALFMGDPNASMKYAWQKGSEPIAEYDGGPETVREGLDVWVVKKANPTSTEIFVLDNGLGVARDPFDLAPATVVF